MVPDDAAEAAPPSEPLRFNGFGHGCSAAGLLEAIISTEHWAGNKSHDLDPDSLTMGAYIRRVQEQTHAIVAPALGLVRLGGPLVVLRGLLGPLGLARLHLLRVLLHLGLQHAAHGSMKLYPAGRHQMPHRSQAAQTAD